MINFKNKKTAFEMIAFHENELHKDIRSGGILLLSKNEILWYLYNNEKLLLAHEIFGKKSKAIQQNDRSQQSEMQLSCLQASLADYIHDTIALYPASTLSTLYGVKYGSLFDDNPDLIRNMADDLAEIMISDQKDWGKRCIKHIVKNDTSASDTIQKLKKQKNRKFSNFPKISF